MNIINYYLHRDFIYVIKRKDRHYRYREPSKTEIYLVGKRVIESSQGLIKPPENHLILPPTDLVNINLPLWQTGDEFKYVLKSYVIPGNRIWLSSTLDNNQNPVGCRTRTLHVNSLHPNTRLPSKTTPKQTRRRRTTMTAYWTSGGHEAAWLLRRANADGNDDLMSPIALRNLFVDADI